MADKAVRRSESATIEHYFAPLCDPDASFGLTDDAAFLTVPDNTQLVITKDMIVADVHFFRDDDPVNIARKALRVNLSDLAAKAAKPLGYLLGLGLPSDWTESWLEAFCEGLRLDQNAFNFPLLGGDTVKSPERLILSVTAFGTVPKDRTIVRPNASPGDDLYATGTIGDGALGLMVRKGELSGRISKDQEAWLLDRFLLPQARTECATLLKATAKAAMDISDGLVGDAGKMARAAGVCLEIDEAAIPLSNAAKSALEQDKTLFDRVLYGGDDYELLFTASPTMRDSIERHAEELTVPVTRIGRVRDGAGVNCVDAKGNVKPQTDHPSYEHF
ncbi:thiamine-monophosphate kinase [Cohaesibacter sp. ES.047]|uniref:thiamine-phosphate kinase n=1 Tax=Cohaesibacter sp. ES.047 TaxID=1798205 RepID=UPI000BB90A85|nr:thiamine-phosphate kinase [Cohaesibacter sp. ES.047]SNY93092.1 thiamine-monophosphate kinase [Cohaesibacter sp. ES.047]